MLQARVQLACRHTPGPGCDCKAPALRISVAAREQGADMLQGDEGGFIQGDEDVPHLSLVAPSGYEDAGVGVDGTGAYPGLDQDAKEGSSLTFIRGRDAPKDVSLMCPALCGVSWGPRGELLYFNNFLALSDGAEDADLDADETKGDESGLAGMFEEDDSEVGVESLDNYADLLEMVSKLRMAVPESDYAWPNDEDLAGGHGTDASDEDETGSDTDTSNRSPAALSEYSGGRGEVKGSGRVRRRGRRRRQRKGSAIWEADDSNSDADDDNDAFVEGVGEGGGDWSDPGDSSTRDAGDESSSRDGAGGGGSVDADEDDDGMESSPLQSSARGFSIASSSVKWRGSHADTDRRTRRPDVRFQINGLNARLALKNYSSIFRVSLPLAQKSSLGGLLEPKKTPDGDINLGSPSDAVGTPSPEVLCRLNGAALSAMGRGRDASVLALMAHVLSDAMGAHAARTGSPSTIWHRSPMAGGIVARILRRYTKARDVQMTALLSCLVLTFEARHKLVPAPGDPSWPDELLVTLCRCRRVYSEWLFRVGAMLARGEVMKRDAAAAWLLRERKAMMLPPVLKPSEDAKSDGNKASPHVGLYTRCRVCTTTRDGSELALNERKGGASAETRPNCGRCAGAIICSICRLPVRGFFFLCRGCGHGGHVRHMQSWFLEESTCPTGCGCSCKAMWRGTPQIDSTVSDTRAEAHRKSLSRDRERVLSFNR